MTPLKFSLLLLDDNSFQYYLFSIDIVNFYCKTVLGDNLKSTDFTAFSHLLVNLFALFYPQITYKTESGWFPKITQLKFSF